MIVLVIVFIFLYTFIEEGIEIKFNEDGTEDRFNKNLCWSFVSLIVIGFLLDIVR